MKKWIIVMLTIAGTAIAAAVNAKSVKNIQHPVTGTAADTEGRPVAYATVVALNGDTPAAGVITADDGSFRLTLPAGSYTLSVEFIGYRTVKRSLEIDGPAELGIITLEEENIAIESVEVKAQIIRREADRFVIDVANMPSAIGNDGVELLQTSPGVFINDNNITINGKTGTKVYVNDREIRYTGDRLLSYLRNLKSEDIQKIEVVPTAGADMDADSAGGIIKITLRQKRDDGVMGTLSFRTSHTAPYHAYAPSFGIDYRTGKWTLSGWGYYSWSSDLETITDRTRYTFNDNSLASDSEQKNRYQWGGGRIGAIYEINDKHSVGAEVEYGHFGSDMKTDADSKFNDAASGLTDSTDDLYNQAYGSDTFTARFNYIAKLDTLGSGLKVLADYTHQKSKSDNNYFSQKQTIADGIPTMLRDSLYRDNAGTGYNITTIGADYDKVFSQKFTLKAGAKYTNNTMSSFSRYELQQAGLWVPREGEYDYDVNYVENIAALYIIGKAQLGRWGLNAGLRGEYTFTSGRSNVARQNYFSLFPNASVSFGLKKDRSYMLIAQYARSIRRPNFWALNPARNQMSEYLYQIGNPDLRPQFSNDVSLSLVMKYKYTLTLGARLVNDDIEQRIYSNAENPNIQIIRTDNIDHTELYYASLNLPFQLAKWWSLNVNITGGWNGTRLDSGDKQVFHPILMGNAVTTFTLPLDFYITLDYNGQSRVHMANISMKSRHSMGISVKKRLFKDKLSLSAGAYNLLPPYTSTFTYSDEAFVRTLKTVEPWVSPMFIFSASYNFNSGRQFNKRAIESSADTSRLEK